MDSSTAGIIRLARRPAGWRAPGPQPAGEQGRAELAPAADEDLCYLLGDWRIFQKLSGHRWSLDDLMTAHYATRYAPQRVERALDLGCGIGSVLLMTAWSFPTARCEGIEAQEVSAGLAARSIAYNGAEGRVTLRHGDLRDPTMLPSPGVFDLVTGTPPYIPVGAGVPSGHVQCEPCRFELRGGVEAYCEAASRALAPHGRFVICEGANPIERTWRAAHDAGLRIIATQDVIPKEGKPALFTLFAMELGPPGELPKPEPPLVVRLADGSRSPDTRRVRERMGIPP